ncbi:MAG: hypothetical protein VCA34_06740 [Roseibacillus sp.]
MITKPIISLGIALLLPTMLWAGQESLTGLVKQEQANSDNEAVSVYGGKVGPADAIFFIEWSGTGNPVEGSYYLPARGKNMIYVLKGTNPRSGVLELEVFTANADGTLVPHARCKLKKRISGDHIVWEGEKFYPNGRSLPIRFSRAE